MSHQERMTCRKIKRIGIRSVNNIVLLVMTILISFALMVALSVTKTNIKMNDFRQVSHPLKVDETLFTHVARHNFPKNSNGSMQLLMGTGIINSGRPSRRLKLKQIYNLVVNGNADQELSTSYEKQHAPADRTKKLPHVIIIGARKCGTRALINMLAMHPDIVRPLNEVHFFDFDNNYVKGIEWYRKQMPLSYKNQITVEKTPAYFTSQKAPERVKNMNASVKIILMVRQPTVRVVSDYIQGVIRHKGQKERKNFSEVVMYNGEIDRFYRPVQTSIYYVHLSRWQQYFNQSQIHIVDGDTLITDPYSEVKLVERFLGVSNYYSPENFYFNETKGYFCLKWRNASRCLGENKGRKSMYPKVSEPLIARMNEFFGPYNELFFNQTRRRFKWETIS